MQRAEPAGQSAPCLVVFPGGEVVEYGQALVRWHRLQAVAKVAGCIFGLPGGLVAQARGPVEAALQRRLIRKQTANHGDSRFRETRI